MTITTLSSREFDALIAATALVHGPSVVTRNIADFAPTGTKIINPWDAIGDQSG